MNNATGKSLYTKAADTKRSTGSTTKIMTAKVVLSQPKLNLDAKVTIQMAYSDYIVSKNASSARLIVGDKVTVRQLLYGLMLPSGCDAAYALADKFGSGKTRAARVAGRGPPQRLAHGPAPGLSLRPPVAVVVHARVGLRQGFRSSSLAVVNIIPLAGICPWLRPTFRGGGGSHERTERTKELRRAARGDRRKRLRVRGRRGPGATADHAGRKPLVPGGGRVQGTRAQQLPKGSRRSRSRRAPRIARDRNWKLRSRRSRR
ncbi:hypothetical protein SVIOM342S_08240 [Streptomyces violaceorubidus]